MEKIKKIVCIMLITGVIGGVTGCGQNDTSKNERSENIVVVQTNQGTMSTPSREVEGVFLGEVIEVEGNRIQMKIQDQQEIDSLGEKITVLIEKKHDAELGEKYTVAYVNKKKEDGDIVVDAVLFEKENIGNEESIKIEVKELPKKEDKK